MSETSKEAIARAYARMDAETEAYSRGEEVAADKRLNDARDGIADAPEKVENIHLPEIPPVSDLQSAIPEPIVANEYYGRYDADQMCAIWGRVRKRQQETKGVPLPKPKGTKSQLLGAKSIERYLAEPIAIVELGPDEQVAEEVELTPGFWDVKSSLWLRYVEDIGLSPSTEEELIEFLDRLHSRWPNGFSPTPPKRLRPRAEEIQEIQDQVEGARRPNDRRTWKGPRLS